LHRHRSQEEVLTKSKKKKLDWSKFDYPVDEDIAALRDADREVERKRYGRLRDEITRHSERAFTISYLANIIAEMEVTLSDIKHDGYHCDKEWARRLKRLQARAV